MSHHQAVFADPHGRRWRAARWIGGSVALAILALLGVLVWGAVTAPLLAPAKLGAAAHRFKPAPTPSGLREPKLHLRPVKNAADAREAQRYAFFVDWDDNSFVSLKRNAANLDVLVPEWLQLANEQGDVVASNSLREKHDRQWLKANAPHLKLTPLVSNFDSAAQNWNSKAALTLLRSPAARAHFAQGLSDYAARHKDAGISLDFEQIPPEAMQDYVAFVAQLSAELHAAGRTLDVSVPADDDDYPYRKVAAAADHLIVMAYDEHAVNNPAGPIASQGWFEKVLDQRFAYMSGSKLVIAIGSYGYDWPDKTDGHEVTVQEAWQTAQDSGAPVAFDSNALNSSYAYADDDGKQHQVWFLDAASAYNQTAAALAMKPAGVALWRLGAEDPGVWSFFAHGRTPDAQAAQAMQTMSSGYDLVYEGQGEVLRITHDAAPGARTFQTDAADNLIVNETISKLPTGLTIQRWGKSADKKIALTFDDGPDKKWTPQVLDILKAKKANATFFIIGQNADENPDLLRRIWREGNDVGSHTYTHPNIGEVPKAEAGFELNATERLLESELGVQPLLFRPPYAEDVEPETIDDARVLQLATKLGYTTISLHIDPGDWTRPGVQQIVDRTLQQAEAGTGNIVLLHDSGGDRAQTIAALPQIIDGLRARGFTLVTVHELLGVPRADLAPALPAQDLAVAMAERASFSMIHGFGQIMVGLFAAGLILGAVRFLVVSVFAGVQALRRRRDHSTDHLAPPSVSVIVPAYNEEKVVAATVQSLLEADLPDFEIIVVDDGSKDRTAEVVRAAYANNPRVRLITKPNGGKASAINTGVEASHSEIVVVIDADTVLAPDALRLLAQRFHDEAVGAVAGNAKVGNPVTLLARFQSIEYMTSQNLDRRAFEALNAIAVVPGAIGGWRRSALMEIGGFTSDTLAEDADATMRLLRAGWKVVYEPRAVARTEAPETLKPFVKQRFRWMYGTLQAVFKHRDAAFDAKVPGLGWFVIPNVAVFQVLFPLVSPVMDVLMAFSLVGGLIAMAMHPAEPMPSGLAFALIFYLTFQLIELLNAAIGFAADRDRDWKLLPLVIVQRFCYRQILYWTAIKALIMAIRGSSVGWGKLERTGRLLQPRAKKLQAAE